MIKILPVRTERGSLSLSPPVDLKVVPTVCTGDVGPLNILQLQYNCYRYRVLFSHQTTYLRQDCSRGTIPHWMQYKICKNLLVTGIFRHDCSEGHMWKNLMNLKEADKNFEFSQLSLKTCIKHQRTYTRDSRYPLSIFL